MRTVIKQGCLGILATVLLGTSAQAANWFVDMSALQVYNGQALGTGDIYAYTNSNRDASSNLANADSPKSDANAIYDDVTGRIAWLGTIRTTLSAGGHYLQWTDGALQTSGGNLTAGSMTCVNTAVGYDACDPMQGGITASMFNFNGAYARIGSSAVNGLLKLATADFAGIETCAVLGGGGDGCEAYANDGNYYFQMIFRITGAAPYGSANVGQVPLPASIWLLAPGLMALARFARKRPA